MIIRYPTPTRLFAIAAFLTVGLFITNCSKSIPSTEPLFSGDAIRR